MFLRFFFFSFLLVQKRNKKGPRQWWTAIAGMPWLNFCTTVNSAKQFSSSTSTYYTHLSDLRGIFQRLSRRLIESIFTFKKCRGGDSAFRISEKQEENFSSYQFESKVLYKLSECSCALAGQMAGRHSFVLDFFWYFFVSRQKST